jgi:outer membrane protein assembly factor BamA
MCTRLGRSLLGALWLALASFCSATTAEANWSVIPIPEFIADPNEGNTFGILPVVLFTNERDQIRYIFAPDFAYNKTKGFFPRLRFFGYPTPTRRYRLVAGKSTTKDERYVAEWSERGLLDGRVFVLASALHERDSTERFFGFGNSAHEAGESNYTGNDTVAQLTPGVWLLPHFALSYGMRIRRFSVEHGQVDSLPFIETEHPEVRDRGLEPGVYWTHRVEMAYDSRDDMDIPERGALALAYAEAADRRLGSASSFVKFGAEWRNFTPLRVRRVRGVLALRAFLDYVSGSADTPFWEQSSLGGRQALRAFGADRFIDFNRSLASAELRVPVYERRLFGVTPVLELAPFFETGQVFHGVTRSPVSDLHVAYGLGFRAVIRPQIVAFVDVGFGYEGSAVFSGVSYPF